MSYTKAYLLKIYLRPPLVPTFVGYATDSPLSLCCARIIFPTGVRFKAYLNVKGSYPLFQQNFSDFKWEGIHPPSLLLTKLISVKSCEEGWNAELNACRIPHCFELFTVVGYCSQARRNDIGARGQTRSKGYRVP